MNKQELVTEVSKETGLSLVNVTTVLDTLIDLITKAVKKDDTVQLGVYVDMLQNPTIFF